MKTVEIDGRSTEGNDGARLDIGTTGDHLEQQSERGLRMRFDCSLGDWVSAEEWLYVSEDGELLVDERGERPLNDRRLIPDQIDTIYVDLEDLLTCMRARQCGLPDAGKV